MENQNNEVTTNPQDNDSTVRVIVSIRGMDIELWKKFKLMAIERDVSMAVLFEQIYQQIEE
jgi:hypothetical protein